jgi:alpha-aminoadipic semialdehyde synthase
MIHCIGIRKETKDITQQRVPLSPEQVRQLVQDAGLRVLVEPMANRIFRDAEYVEAGAELTSDFSDCNIVIGIKEIGTEYMEDGKPYMFFSHTIKGQSYNMAMLQHILDHGNTLFDYELIKDAEGRRLVFFGNFAGYAGMIDSMWAMKQRLQSEGIESPFAGIQYATSYDMLEDAEAAFREAAERIRTEGLPKQLVPFVCGFTGYGNVSKGAQHLYDLLPCESIAPEELADFYARGEFSDHVVYKVEFHEHDMFTPRESEADFILNEFFDQPEKYEAVFDQYLPYLSMMINGIYWEPRYPRLVTKEAARALFQTEKTPRLRVIGDVTCDIDGSVQLTVKETNSLNPVFVYEPLTDTVIDGWEGNGPVILAVDKLPTELPREASTAFGASLLPFVPALADCDMRKSFESLDLPDALRNSIVAHQGKLVPAFVYLEKKLPQ